MAAGGRVRLPLVTDKYKTMKINASASFASPADRSTGRRHRANASIIPRERWYLFERDFGTFTFLYLRP